MVSVKHSRTQIRRDLDRVLRWVLAHSSADQFGQSPVSRLMRSPLLRGVSIARKVVNGVITEHDAIVFHVLEKKSVRSQEKIPAFLPVGRTGRAVKTDIRRVSPLRLASNVLGTMARLSHAAQRMPILRPGANLSHVNAKTGGGTFGCLVERVAPDDHALYILSAAHVLADLAAVDPRGEIVHPGSDLTGRAPDDVVADYFDHVALRFGEGFLNEADAAIARVRDNKPVSPDIGGIGIPVGAIIRPRAGTEVMMLGSMSGPDIVGATIESTKYNVQSVQDIPGGGAGFLGFRDLIATSNISQGGDSGAALVSKSRKIVGILFGEVDDLELGRTLSLFSRMAPIMARLGIDVVSAEDWKVRGSRPTGNSGLPGAEPTMTPSELSRSPSVKSALARLRKVLPDLQDSHAGPFGGVSWRLTPLGLEVDGEIKGTVGALVTVPKVWQNFGVQITHWANHYGVPIELIIATVCTETGGNQFLVRTEPNYVSDDATPDQVSPGLMQTLISTARHTLNMPGIDRAWLLNSNNSIRAGTCYIDEQRRKKNTRLDPPKVACAYNAGSLVKNDGIDNRWKMRQFPIGTSKHADRFVLWFNDCFLMFEQLGSAPAMSYFALQR